MITQSPTAWVKIAEGVRRRIVADGEKLMVVEVQLDMGASIARHQHPHEQISYVLSGRVRFEVEGQPKEVSTGGTIHLPSNVPHAVTALENSLVLDMFSPPREDLRG